MANKIVKQRRRLGDIVAIRLNDGTFGFGRVLREPLMAFYDFHTTSISDIETIVASKILFTVFVMNSAVVGGHWKVIGNAPLSGSLIEEPLFFKKDLITGKLTIYRDSTGAEAPATREQCISLEAAAVWEPQHIIDRLSDHFANRPNKWVESMRL